MRGHLVVFASLVGETEVFYCLIFELKIKLEQVTPPSAFCNSDRSIARVLNRRFSSRARVLGKEAGKITTLLSRSAFAAAGSSAGISSNSNSQNCSTSTQDRFTRMAPLPMYEHALFRCRQPFTSTGCTRYSQAQSRFLN